MDEGSRGERVISECASGCVLGERKFGECTEEGGDTEYTETGEGEGWREGGCGIFGAG